MGLPKNSELRDSLTRMPPKDMRQLIRHIEEYKRLEDDRLQSKGTAPVIKSSSVYQFTVQALEGFEDSRARAIGGGSECSLQGTGALDCGSN